MNRLVVERATDADWPRLWPIWHEVVAAGDTYCYEPATPSEVARADWLDPLPSECWLARLGDEVLGMYHLSPNQAGPGSHVVNGSYMVAAAARGSGVGRAMVEHSLRRAREAGYLAMQFNAVVETNAGAIHLYEDLGFVRIGRVPRAFRHPARGLVDLVIMYRDLDGP